VSRGLCGDYAEMTAFKLAKSQEQDRLIMASRLEVTIGHGHPHDQTAI
jgi:hypothetical protein